MVWRFLWLVLGAYFFAHILTGLIEDPTQSVGNIRAAVFITILFVSLFTFSAGRDDGSKRN